MQWIYAAHPSAAVQVFNLVENNFTRTSLRYHPRQKTLRIRAANGQRVFSIKAKDQQSIFLNEYGFEVGQFNMDTRQQHGSLLFENDLYTWRMASQASREIRIYQANTLFAVCSMEPSVLKKGKQGELAALVLCTCLSISGALRQPAFIHKPIVINNAATAAANTLVGMPVLAR